MSLKSVKDKLKKVSSLFDGDKLLRRILDNPGVKQQIIDLNQSQMFDQGVDSKGVTLGDYSQISVTKFGKRPGHIQLYDTGEFYSSMKVSGENITADMIKPDVNLETIYPKALGLTDESYSILREFVRPVAIEEIRKESRR